MSCAYARFLSPKPLERAASREVDRDATFIFASYAESDEQLRHTLYLAESIRDFAGAYGAAPVRIYLPEFYEPSDIALVERLHGQEVSLHVVSVPEKARWFCYAGKVYAAAIAEQQAVGMSSVLAWMDEDTVVLQPPEGLALPRVKVMGYRPVMHNRSGSAMNEEPNAFWARVYELSELRDDQLYPMMTVGDKVTIRPYFNAGLLAVRPEVGVLRRWPSVFEILYEDTAVVTMCQQEQKWRVFLHQAALVGAVLGLADRDRLVELDDRYNYPLFFDRQWSSQGQFDDIGDVITLRYDTYFQNPDPDWSSRLTGRPEIIEWLVERFG